LSRRFWAHIRGRSRTFSVYTLLESLNHLGMRLVSRKDLLPIVKCKAATGSQTVKRRIEVADA
jgi:hypothetical protein